jgi:hypothetical protein
MLYMYKHEFPSQPILLSEIDNCSSYYKYNNHQSHKFCIGSANQKKKTLLGPLDIPEVGSGV